MMVKRHPSSANQLAPPDNRNLLLAALPADEYTRVAKSLDTIPLKLKSVVHRVGDPVEHVYFPGGVLLDVDRAQRRRHGRSRDDRP